MITRQDLDERIAEIKNKRDQTETECMKLAAFLIIRNDLDGTPAGSYGSASPVVQVQSEESTIGDYGDTDFLRLVAGRRAADVWAVLDEAMSALKLSEPRMYAGIMRKIGS